MLSDIVPDTASTSTYHKLTVEQTVAYATAAGLQQSVTLDAYDDRSVTVRVDSVRHLTPTPSSPSPPPASTST